MTGTSPSLPADDGFLLSMFAALERRRNVAPEPDRAEFIKQHLAELAATSLGTPEVWRIIKLADVGAVADILARGEDTEAGPEQLPDTSVLFHLVRHTVTSWGIEWTWSQVRAVREFIDHLRDGFGNPRFHSLRRPIPGSDRNRFDFVLDEPDYKPAAEVCDAKKWSEGGQRVVTRAVAKLAEVFAGVGRPEARKGKANLQQEFSRLYQALRVAEKILGLSEDPDRLSPYYTICAVALDAFDDRLRSGANLVAMRGGMYESVRNAFADTGIPWNECYTQDVGDGMVIIAPPAMAKGAFAGQLPPALAAALRGYNVTHPPEERIRLRLAVHTGEVTYDEHGVTSPAVIHACRLVDARSLKDALAILPGMLGVIASDWFYKEVVMHDLEHAPDSYRRLTVDNKEVSAVAWVRLLDHEPLLEAAMSSGEPPRGVIPARFRPGSHGFYELVDALEAVSCMRSEYTRGDVVDRLPFGGYVGYAPSRRAHVTNVVRTCLDYEYGMGELVKVLATLEPSDSPPLRQLLSLLIADTPADQQDDR